MPRPSPDEELYRWILKRLDKCRPQDWIIRDNLEKLARKLKAELERGKQP